MVANDGWAGRRCQGRQPPKAVAAGQPLQRRPAQPSSHRGSMASMREVLERAAVRMLQNVATTREAYRSECSDGICRLFLCSRCRVQVLVCRRCDRGQIYCFGACAQEARRERRREARRRYQATDRGRAMHADRNRRYRARRRCVTDHGPLVTRSERRLPTVNTASSDPLAVAHLTSDSVIVVRDRRRRLCASRPCRVAMLVAADAVLATHLDGNPLGSPRGRPAMPLHASPRLRRLRAVPRSR
jgi:hypothetical protein